MKARKLAILFLAGLLTLGLTACFGEDDDDEGGGGLVGIWRYTQAGVDEETVQLSANGAMMLVYADLVNDICEEWDAGYATWNSDEDSIYVTVSETINGQTITETFGTHYVLSGNTLTLTTDDGTLEAYSRISSMIDCNHYSGGSGSGLAGIWQYTQAGVEEETAHLMESGEFLVVDADLVNQVCDQFESGMATWSNDADSIYVTVSFEFQGQTFTETSGTAYALNGNSMVLTDEEGTRTYNRISTMIDCDHYGFGSSSGGNLSCTVDGTAMDFSDFVFASINGGAISVTATGGSSQIVLTVLGDTAGSYDLSANGNQATFIPDTSSPLDLFLANFALGSGTITIDSVSNGTVTGTFEFTAVRASDMTTVTITGGSFSASE